MVKFQCENCRFAFSPKGDKQVPPRICPYCNKQGTVVRQKSADELLNEFTDVE